MLFFSTMKFLQLFIFSSLSISFFKYVISYQSLKYEKLELPLGVSGPKVLYSIVMLKGTNETRHLTSYSNSTRSKLDSSESSSLTRNVNESSRATRNSIRKAHEKLENILYIKF